jgi:predicted RNA-binding protein
VRFFWGAAALGCLLSAMPAVSQAPKEASSSAIISPKSESKADSSIEPRKPSITEDSDDSIVVDPSTLLPDLPPLPEQKATLVGGTVDRIDLVRDKVTVRLFGGGKASFLFDTRTQVLRAGKPVAVADLHEGERIYLDTILDGSDEFARTIRLSAARATGTSQGVVVRFRRDRSAVILRDALSPNSVEVRLSPSTRVSEAGRSVPIYALVPGSLISLSFSSVPDAGNTATEITILAQPGAPYTFSGQVVHIDLRTGLLVLNSATDRKTYEVYLASGMNADENLRPGANVTVIAAFDGERYVVRNIRFTSQ